MVRDALTRRLAVLVETHLLVVDDAVHVVPRPANHRAAGGGGHMTNKHLGVARSPETTTGEDTYLLEAFLLWPSHSCLRCRNPSSSEDDSWFLVGSVDDWLLLLFLPEVGEGAGLVSLELRSATPFTRSPLSTASWRDQQRQSVSNLSFNPKKRGVWC